MSKQTREHFLASGLVPCPDAPADDPCMICHSESESQWVKMGCNCPYAYHQECISFWLKDHNTCPSCRKELFFGPKDIDEFMSSEFAPPEEHFNLPITEDVVDEVRHFEARRINQISNHFTANRVDMHASDEALINADIMWYYLRRRGTMAIGMAILQGDPYTEVELAQLVTVIRTLGALIRNHDGDIVTLEDLSELLHSGLVLQLILDNGNRSKGNELIQIAAKAEFTLSDEDSKIAHEIKHIIAGLRFVGFSLQFDKLWRNEDDDHYAMMQVSGTS